MPQPSYTVDTLVRLREKHPKHAFSLLMGGDNLTHLKKWKNYEQILENHAVYVYPRPQLAGAKEGTDEIPKALKTHGRIIVVDAPSMHISATYIRKQVKAGNSIRYIVPEKVAELIDARKYYQ